MSVCRHCEARKGYAGRRGLCQRCHKDPAVRALYPAAHGATRRPEPPTCWACGGQAVQTVGLWQWGWVSREVVLPGGVRAQEIYCRPCVNVHGVPDWGAILKGRAG